MLDSEEQVTCTRGDLEGRKEALHMHGKLAIKIWAADIALLALDRGTLENIPPLSHV